MESKQTNNTKIGVFIYNIFSCMLQYLLNCTMLLTISLCVVFCINPMVDHMDTWTSTGGVLSAGELAVLMLGSFNFALV